MTSTIVVGASVAGLLTARVLSDLVDEVVILERERLTDAPSPRGRVPQGKHLHLLLTAGLDRLVAWFPGIERSKRCGSRSARELFGGSAPLRHLPDSQPPPSGLHGITPMP